MSLFSSASADTQIGVDFLPGGVAIAQVQAGRKNPGKVLRSEFVEASGQQQQVEALKNWIRDQRLQKTPCVCLIARDDCDVYQVEKPEVEDGELIQAVTWKIKDLINYDVAHAVIDSYPIPGSSKNNQNQVGVVAAREAVVGSYVEGIKSCGVKLVALDIHELVPCNLPRVQQTAEQNLAILSLAESNGLLNIYHDGDMYVTRDFKIGIEQLDRVSSEDESVFDSLLLEIQRSLDYFESYFGMGAVTHLQIFPQLPGTEKMAMYVQNLTSFDIDFIATGSGQDDGDLEQHCFHAYCAALRGVTR